jgi:hypothetical protein
MSDLVVGSFMVVQSLIGFVLYLYYINKEKVC